MYKYQIILISFFVFNKTVILGQIYPVSEMTIEIKTNEVNSIELNVKPFYISNFVTVKEFKNYLDAIKKDSSNTFYKSQLPKSKTFSIELANAILNNSELQNAPMPGVSWIVARNYCKWLNVKSKLNEQNYEYDLPFVSELIAYNKLYGNSQNQILESWTLNSYDESIMDNLKFNEYKYDANKTDPPALKRKVIYGGSFQMNYFSSDLNRQFQYEYQDSSSRFIGFRVVRKIKDNMTESLNVNNLKFDFSTQNNFLHGLYQEKYSNGSLKVLGSFSSGQRTGIWTVWDEYGKLKIQRNYINNRTCELIYPLTNNPYKELYKQHPEYVLVKNNLNFYPYKFVEERTVVYSKRLWNVLNDNNEPYLFEKINFNDIVQEIFEKNIKWYHYGQNADLSIDIPKDSILMLKATSKNWDFKRIEIKEDFFFNSDELLSETRQLAISFYKNSSDKKPSYTVYFPNIRSILASYEISKPAFPEIKTLDDLFFFHLYNGQIKACGEVFNPNKTQFTEHSKFDCELEKISEEHNLWLMFNR